MPRSLVTPVRPVLVALVLPFAACASAGDLGEVPEGVVELYDVGRPGGVIEIELDRDGSVREMEVEVAIESLPPAIVAAARARHPQGRIVGGERELTSEGPGWEVKVEDQGRMLELVYDEDGELIETERELTRAEAPPLVIDAAQAAIGGRMKSVEVIERGGKQRYHVKLERDGASYKVILTPDGRIVRKVREHRAEIEIPLAD